MGLSRRMKSSAGRARDSKKCVSRGQMQYFLISKCKYLMALLVATASGIPRGFIFIPPRCMSYEGSRIYDGLLLTNTLQISAFIFPRGVRIEYCYILATPCAKCENVLENCGRRPPPNCGRVPRRRTKHGLLYKLPHMSHIVICV